MWDFIAENRKYFFLGLALAVAFCAGDWCGFQLDKIFGTKNVSSSGVISKQVDTGLSKSINGAKTVIVNESKSIESSNGIAKSVTQQSNVIAKQSDSINDGLTILARLQTQ